MIMKLDTGIKGYSRASIFFTLVAATRKALSTSLIIGIHY